MKIPRRDGLPSVATRPVGTNYSNLDFRDGTETLQRGIGAVGAGVDAVQKANLEAKAKADALVEAEAAYQLDARAQARLTQFRQAKGLKAAETSAELFKGLEQDREEVAKRIGSASARQRFLTRSLESLTTYRRTGEGHVSAQLGAAREETLNARAGQAIGIAETGLDPEGFITLSRQVEEDIRANAESPAVAEAKVADFKSKAGLAIVQGLLARGKTEEARGYVDEARKFLGGRYVEAEGLVQKAMAGAERDRRVAEGAKLVDGTYDSLLMEARQSGEEYVDEDKLKDAVKLNESDPGVRSELEAALNRRIQDEARRKRADIGTQRDNANRADLQRTAIPGETYKFLEKHDPDFLLAREARLRAEARAARVARHGDKQAKAASAAAQKAVDQEFLFRLQTELTNDPATKPDDFLVEFIAEKAKEGDDVSISDVARAKAGLEAAKSGKKAEKGESTVERDAAKRFEATINAATPKVKGKPKDQAKLNERVGKALKLFRDRTEAKGKPLDETELAAIEAEVVREVRVEVPRTVLGIPLGTKSEKRMGVDLLEGAPEAAAAAGPEEKTVGGKAYVKRNGKWVLK